MGDEPNVKLVVRAVEWNGRKAVELRRSKRVCVCGRHVDGRMYNWFESLKLSAR